MSAVARRRLLALLVVAPVAGLATGRPAAAAAWTRLFNDLESAGLIGRAVLESHPGLGGARAIAARLRQRHAVFRDLLDDTVARPPRAALAQAIAADFAAGRTLTAAGWVLGQSEAELCALVHLG